MQIAYSEHTIDAIMEIFSTGFKVADGDKVVKRDWFIDPIQGKVIFRHHILRKGEDEPAPLIVLPN